MSWDSSAPAAHRSERQLAAFPLPLNGPLPGGWDNSSEEDARIGQARPRQCFDEDLCKLRHLKLYYQLHPPGGQRGACRPSTWSSHGRSLKPITLHSSRLLACLLAWLGLAWKSLPGRSSSMRVVGPWLCGCLSVRDILRQNGHTISHAAHLIRFGSLSAK